LINLDGRLSAICRLSRFSSQWQVKATEQPFNVQAQERRVAASPAAVCYRHFITESREEFYALAEGIHALDVLEDSLANRKFRPRNSLEPTMSIEVSVK